MVLEDVSGQRRFVLYGVGSSLWDGERSVERGRLREGGGRGSSWWREIVKIRDGVGGLGGG
ncbi:hypothetical protein A2U01_0096214, partial [Trifolium medium]|nr:hypothetical protein [Trifolium medium]